MYDVYLFDILFTWFLFAQILMINKLFTKVHKIFLERMTNHLESKNILSWKFLEPWRKIKNSLELSFSCQRSFEQVLELPRRVEKLVEYSRINVFIFSIRYHSSFLIILDLS